MGHVSELELRELGVRFKPGYGTYRVLAPDDAIVRAQIDAEIVRRSDLMTPCLPLVGDVAVPIIPIVSPPPKRVAGACWSCGDARLPGRGAQCALCTLGLQRALVRAGRLTR